MSRLFDDIICFESWNYLFSVGNNINYDIPKVISIIDFHFYRQIYKVWDTKKVEKIETQSDEYTERLFNAKTLIFLLPFINYSSKGNDYNIIPLILLYEIFVVLLLKLFFPFYAIILVFLATILSQGECVYTNQDLK